MNPFSDAGRAHSALLGAVFVTAVLLLSACSGTGRFSAAAILLRSSGARRTAVYISRATAANSGKAVHDPNDV